MRFFAMLRLWASAKRRGIGVVLSLLILAVLLVYWGRSAEPVYHGQKLRHWVALLNPVDRLEWSYVPRETDEAVQAVRAIGPDAIPYLVRWTWMRDQPKPFHEAVVKWLKGSPRLLSMEEFVYDKIDPYLTEESVPLGYSVPRAFQILGPKATKAIPELTRIAETMAQRYGDPNGGHPVAGRYGMQCVLKSLACLGKDAVPKMLQVAQSLEGKPVQSIAVGCLGDLGADGIEAVPVLLGWTTNQNPLVRSAAILALDGIPGDPAQVIPVLTARTHDSDTDVAFVAAKVLSRFGVRGHSGNDSPSSKSPP
ncbi:MAG TPA: HEAT repeat domain-containing protein [Candidatus Limnocylindria bacterium]|nr:HEAT repeat domain-containing protein [Candidatus Limnocylindria bacterium]